MSSECFTAPPTPVAGHVWRKAEPYQDGRMTDGGWMPTPGTIAVLHGAFKLQGWRMGATAAEWLAAIDEE